MPTLHLIIKGKVQGVFYRATANKVAKQWGVSGWVRNTKEGNVEIVASGNDEQLNSFVNWCKQGPSFARVDQVEVQITAEQHFEGFEILRY